MRFGETLIEKMTQEWYSEYISFEKLEAMLIGGPEKMKNQMEDEFLILKFNFLEDDPNEDFMMFELEFVRQCKKNLEKVKKFCATKIAKINSELKSLKQNLHEIRRQMSENEKNKNWLTSSLKEIYLDAKMKSLKRYICDTRFSIARVKMYHHINVGYLRKILKEHDELWKNTRGDNFHRKHVLSYAIVTSRVLDQLRLEIDTILITN